MNRARLVSACTGCLVLLPVATACVMDDVNPHPTSWWFIKEPSPVPGFTRQQFYMNVGIFPPTDPLGTSCVCGFGYSGGVIPGLVPMDASVVIWDPATEQVVGSVPQFDPLGLNGNTTAGFNDTTAYPAGAGYNWIGFGGLIPAFSPPVIPPNFRFAVCIVIDVPNEWDPILKSRWGCLAGGVGDANFNPLFQGEHAVGDPFACVPLPAPGAGVMCVMGGLLACRRRR